MSDVRCLPRAQNTGLSGEAPSLPCLVRFNPLFDSLLATWRSRGPRGSGRSSGRVCWPPRCAVAPPRPRPSLGCTTVSGSHPRASDNSRACADGGAGRPASLDGDLLLDGVGGQATKRVLPTIL